ncbi:hypothetical protein AB0I28_07475 [Phytomonospora sp. NPDC050363]
MTRIIKRLVIVAAVALAAVGISITAAASAGASDNATGAVITENEHEWT